MRKVILFLILVSLTSCSLPTIKNKFQDSKNIFSFKDKTGSYYLDREVRLKGTQIVVRRKITPQMKRELTLEKTIAVSQVGSIGKKRVPSMRPVVAQHTIWFEKQKYMSQIKVNTKKRALEVVMESPEEKWNGKKTIPFPRGKVFCFFSQIPECVKVHGFLGENPKGKELYIIWDSYPYQIETFEGVGSGPFQSAIFEFNGVDEKSKRYTLNLGNQLIFYHFNYDNEFEKMYWISQGISMVR
jgi:hypothetical protein